MAVTTARTHSAMIAEDDYIASARMLNNMEGGRWSNKMAVILRAWNRPQELLRFSDIQERLAQKGHPVMALSRNLRLMLDRGVLGKVNDGRYFIACSDVNVETAIICRTAASARLVSVTDEFKRALENYVENAWRDYELVATHIELGLRKRVTKR